MPNKIIRLSDYESRSRNPDSIQPRNPADANVIVLPREERDHDMRRHFTDLIEKVW